MGYNNKPARHSICATDLAKLGMCEKRMVLDLQYGEGKVSKRARVRSEEGREIHERALQAAIAHNQVREPATDRRCYIATAVYGADAWQTNALRAWRDRALLTNVFGRVVVAAYYALSPKVAKRLGPNHGLTRIARSILDAFVRATGVGL